MKREQGFSLIELLIVVAIIAIIAAIAVPSMLQARMAANEAGAIQGCRTVGSAEVAFAAVNNQSYAILADLITAQFLDDRFSATNTFNGYGYADGDVTINPANANIVTNVAGGGFGIVATPSSGKARYIYGIAPDQVVRYQGVDGSWPEMKCGSAECTPGDPIGKSSAASGS
jgi:type IV pilus assembly protein PilA